MEHLSVYFVDSGRYAAVLAIPLLMQEKVENLLVDDQVVSAKFSSNFFYSSPKANGMRS